VYNQQLANQQLAFNAAMGPGGPSISQHQFAANAAAAAAAAAASVPGGQKESKKRSSAIAFQDETGAGSPNSGGDDESGSDEQKTEKRQGRRKINIEFITDKSRRHITFSKRKLGIMKKVRCLDSRGAPGSAVMLTIRLLFFFIFSFVLSWPIIGLRAFYADWYSGAALGGFGDRTCVHICDAQASASDYEA
jgi:hypothetical protein